MDPPRLKVYKQQARAKTFEVHEQPNRPGFLFFICLTFVSSTSVAILVYAYRLQVRYKSEKFRCETPFFHRRDERNGASSPVAAMAD